MSDGTRKKGSVAFDRLYAIARDAERLIDAGTDWLLQYDCGVKF